MIKTRIIPFGFGCIGGRVMVYRESEPIEPITLFDGGLLLLTALSPTLLQRLCGTSIRFLVIPACSPYSHSASWIWNCQIPVASLTSPINDLQEASFAIIDFEACHLQVAFTSSECQMLEATLYTSQHFDIVPEKNFIPPFQVYYEANTAENLEFVVNNRKRLSIVKPESFLLKDGVHYEKIERFKALTKNYHHPIYLRFFDTFGKYQESGFGYRGVRLMELNDDIFSLFKKLLLTFSDERIIPVLPMVTSWKEISQVKRQLKGIADRIGVTIETPAAALSIKEILAVTDFIEIGTNDLTQFIMGWDRNILHAERLPFDQLSPPVSQIMENVTNACIEKGIDHFLGIDLKPTKQLALQLKEIKISSISCPFGLGQYWEKV